jgi:sucrose phosphorylase
VLDTHDGIGIIDVGPMNGKSGLLNEIEINNLVETIHLNSAGESKKATGSAASNVDLYQVNCTYYDALGQNDFDYLVARAIQFFSPGIPQIYYAGLLGETNDMVLLDKNNVGRDINRPYVNVNKIEESLKKPITKSLIELIKIRNACDAFNGNFTISDSSTVLIIEWTQKDCSAKLLINLADKEALIELYENDNTRIINLEALLK